MFKAILNALQEMRKIKTHQKITEDTGVSGSYVCDIANGKKPVSGMTLATIQKLFPQATINLYGSQMPSSQLTTAEEKLLFLFRSMPEARQFDLLIELARETKPEEEKSRVG